MAASAVSDHQQHNSAYNTPNLGYNQQQYQQQYQQQGQDYEQMKQQPVTQDYFSPGYSVLNLFDSKVLYLMVVNMPTDEEMAKAEKLTKKWNVQGNPQQYATT